MEENNCEDVCLDILNLILSGFWDYERVAAPGDLIAMEVTEAEMEPMVRWSPWSK